MFLIFVSPTVSLKKRLSTRFGLTILSRGITRSSRPNLSKKMIVFCPCRERAVLVLPGGLTDVSVPHIVGQDALGLVLQQLNTAGRGQAGRLWLEQDDCLHAAALGGVRRHVAEPGTLQICETACCFHQRLLLQKWPMASKQAKLILEGNRMEKMIQLLVCLESSK